MKSNAGSSIRDISLFISLWFTLCVDEYRNVSQNNATSLCCRHCYVIRIMKNCFVEEFYYLNGMINDGRVIERKWKLGHI